jgi:zinc protease
MIEKYTLKNGIPVFIVENHAAPVVSIQAWVSRGSCYENEKVAGISHFLEHALFKGTKKRKVGEIALEIESRGGEVNAFTSFEETAYYTTLASRYFEDGLDVIADAIQNPSFDAEEMLREREVILEEIKRAHDSPYKMVSTNLWKTCFEGTPYGRPVLGFEETVRKIDHRTLKQYFDQHYHAGTVSLFIVGDVDKKMAFEKAKAKLSKMKRGKAAKIPNLKAPHGNKVRVVTLARDLNECHGHLAWPAPAIDDPSVPILDVLCTAFGSGESSRLYQRLVKERQVALEAHMGLMATARCGLASVSIQAAPEHLHATLTETMRLLEEAAFEGLREEEIERVKSSLEAEVVGGKETVEGYARRLGYYYIQFGDPEYEKKYLEAVLAVETSEVNKALSKLLDKKPVLSIAHPISMKADHKQLIASLSREKRKHVPPPEPTAAIELKKNGNLRFVEKVVTNLPIVSMRLLFPGGARQEPKGKHGLSTLFQRVWSSGTPSYNSKQIAHVLESLGASLHSYSGKHTMGLSVEFLAKQWPVIKPLLTEILLCPSFPEDEFLTEKNLLLRDILSERDTPGSVCQLNFISALYGDHTYGRSSLGTQETVSKLTTEDLKNFYRDYIHQKRVVISTVGHFNREVWKDELSQLLGKLPESGKDLLPTQSARPIEQTQVILEKKEPLFQSHIMVGFLAADFNDPQRLALKLLSSALAGQGGRLFLELRDKQSLAYTVAPMNSDTPERGMFGFYIGCSPEKMATAIWGIRKEIEKILDKPISASELDRAKKYWIGRFELEMQRFGAQAMMYGLDEIYGLGFDHSLTISEKIRAVSAVDIQKAAQKFLKLNQATLSVVHKEDVGEDAVHSAWEGRTTKKSASAPGKTVSSSL